MRDIFYLFTKYYLANGRFYVQPRVCADFWVFKIYINRQQSAWKKKFFFFSLHQFGPWLELFVEEKKRCEMETKKLRESEWEGVSECVTDSVINGLAIEIS